MRRPTRIAGLAVGALLVAAPARAQRPAPPKFDVGLSGGTVFPVRQFKAFSKKGVAGNLEAGYRVKGPVGLRANILYQDVRGIQQGLSKVDRKLTAAVLDVVLHVMVDEDSPLHAYFYAGGGVYHQKAKDVMSGQEATANQGGLQLGLGLSYGFSNLRPYFEAQYNDIFLTGNNIKTAPIMIGFRYGGF